MAVGLPTVLVATSTRCRGDVCAHARVTRSASAANLRAIEGDMCARECRVREPACRAETLFQPPSMHLDQQISASPKGQQPVTRILLGLIIGGSRRQCVPRERTNFRVKRAAGEPRVALGVGVPVGEAVEAPRLGRTMVGILRTPAQDSGRSPYHETPGSTRTYDWRRIDHTVRAIPGRFQRVATFTGCRAAFGRSNRARHARSAALASQIHHNSLARLDSSPIARHSS